jgi:hypothetical protein
MINSARRELECPVCLEVRVNIKITFLYVCEISFIFFFNERSCTTRVANPEPGIRDKFFTDPGSATHISES